MCAPERDRTPNDPRDRDATSQLQEQTEDGETVEATDDDRDERQRVVGAFDGNSLDSKVIERLQDQQ